MFDRIFGLTMPWALKSEALEYSKRFGYPVSPDAVTGRPNEHGQGDARDAFRHLYGTAVLAYEGGTTPARDIAEWGESLGRNPEFLADMDRKNNAIAIDISKKVRAKFAGIPNISEQQIKDEIAREANEAITSGKATFYTTRDNDADFTPPADFGTMNLVAGDGMWESDVPAGGRRNNPVTSVADILGDYVTKPGGKKGGFLRRVVLPTSMALADALTKSRKNSLQEALLEALTGDSDMGRIIMNMNNSGMMFPSTSQGVRGSGTPGFPDIFAHLIERIALPALSRGRSRTTSSESDRSVAAREAWNTSQGQQASALAQYAQQGQRNL